MIRPNQQGAPAPGPRPDLLLLTTQVLAELTNVGTVRRAAKDLDQGLTVDWASDGETLVARRSDDVVCRLGAGHFDTWECSCPAMQRCRHLVGAVLAWQRDAAEIPADATAPDPAHDDPPPSPESGTGPEQLFSARVRREGDRLADQLVARVTTAPRLVVRLHLPMEISVRFPVGEDPRFARCECGTPACLHLYLALRARDLLPAGATGALVRADPADVRSHPAIAAAAAEHPQWRSWLAQLLDSGTGAAGALISGAVRLASRWEDSGLRHPAAALREIAEQLEHAHGRDSQLSPERVVELIGEVEARLRTLIRAGDDGPDEVQPVPAGIVAGVADTEVSGGGVRLLGIGAEHRHVGGWNALGVFLLDIRTGAVSVLSVEREDTEDRTWTAADLGVLRVGATPLAEWAAGSAMLGRGRRRGERLILGRQRVSVAPAARLDLDATAAVLPSDLSEVAATLPDLPAPLGPRRRSDGVTVGRIGHVADVSLDPATSTVAATVLDHAGHAAALRAVWSGRNQSGVLALHALLTDCAEGAAEPVAVAGRWRRGESGLSLEPTAFWTADGVLLPQLHHQVGLTTSRLPPLPGSGVDPWSALWGETAEAVGRLLVLGVRRGAARVDPELRALAARADGVGLQRLAGALGAVVPEPASAGHRVEALADLCVLVAFAQ
ncbi:hypothetical protein [Nocardioides sp. GXZ039]|uniref:hypothetical protein n=1 Tax=Nocardioides sp. GXZ039 TaxID=3136018 RepID=UPI0030F3D820